LKPESTRAEYHAALHAVRGLCAAAVLVHHIILSSSAEWLETWHTALFYTPLEHMFSGGKFVRFMYVVSGYVLFLSYLHSKRWSTAEFYIRRFSRLWLPFVAASLVSLSIVSVLHHQVAAGSSFSEWYWAEGQPKEAGLRLWLSHILLTGQFDAITLNCASWSLTHELRFVLLFPLLAALASRNELMVLAGAVAGSVISKYGYAYLGEGGFYFTAETPLGAAFATLHFLPFFVAGMVIAKRQDDLIGHVRALKPWGIVACWALGYFAMRRNQDLVVVAGAALFLMLILAGERNGNWSKSPVLKWLGYHSYSIYLVHMPIIILCAQSLDGRAPYAILLPLELAAALAAAAVFERLVTHPCAQLGKRLTTQWRARQAGASSAESIPALT
jgi:peptidoglycan/LPS O-acetylase OafA/YrhL